MKMRMKKMKRVSPTNAWELKLQILVHVNGLAIKIPVIRCSVAGNLEGNILSNYGVFCHHSPKLNLPFLIHYTYPPNHQFKIFAEIFLACKILIKIYSVGVAPTLPSPPPSLIAHVQINSLTCNLLSFWFPFNDSSIRGQLVQFYHLAQ